MADWVDVEPHTVPSSFTSFIQASPESDYATGGTMRNVEYADQVLEGLDLSDDARDCLRAVTDPFHDVEIDWKGWPDGQANRTFTRMIQESVTIQKDAGLPAGAWDAHIAALPLNCTISAFDATTRQNVFVSAVNPGNLGLVSIVSSGTGQLSFPDSSAASLPPATNVKQGLGLTTITSAPGAVVGYASDRGYADGKHRVLGLAIEVANVGPLLDQSGNVVCYRQNASRQRANWQFADTATGTMNVNGSSTRGDWYQATSPPASPEIASQIPNSRIFEARLGCYLVGVLEDDGLDYVSPASQMLMLTSGQTTCGNVTNDDFDSVSTVIGNYSPSNYTGTGNSAPAAFSCNGMCQFGAYFTGLPDDARLVVTMRVLVEYAPDQFSPDITIARPSPSPDLALWHYYKLMMDHIPPGVPLRDNFLGKYVKKAADIVKSVANSEVGNLALDAAEAKMNPTTRAKSQMLRAALKDREAAADQAEAARIRERAGVLPSRAADIYAGLTPLERRRVKRRMKRRRQAEKKRLLAIRSGRV